MKKPSAAKPPERFVFFVDRSLGKYDVPNALRSAGHNCEVHDDHLGPATEDEVWLGELADRKWVVLTKDERIRYRPLEIGALRAARLRVFIVVCGNVTGKATADVILKAMPAMTRLLERDRGSFLAYVYKDGSVKKK